MINLLPHISWKWYCFRKQKLLYVFREKMSKLSRETSKVILLPLPFQYRAGKVLWLNQFSKRIFIVERHSFFKIFNSRASPFSSAKHMCEVLFISFTSYSWVRIYLCVYYSVFAHHVPYQSLFCRLQHFYGNIGHSLPRTGIIYVNSCIGMKDDIIQ